MIGTHHHSLYRVGKPGAASKSKAKPNGASAYNWLSESDQARSSALHSKGNCGNLTGYSQEF